MLCCNQVEYTRQCLESVLRHTRAPYELVLVDNGSTDGTAEYLAEIGRQSECLAGSLARSLVPKLRLGTHPSETPFRGTNGAAGRQPGRETEFPERAFPNGVWELGVSAGVRIHVIRNATNVGFPAGCNQGLQRARGRYVVFLNNDTIVTEGWLEGLVRWSLFEWPKVGMVGPVTNFSSQPQQIGVDYQELSGLPGFAVRQRNKFANQAQRVERLTGFCLLVRREVLDKIGGFDERFGLGFFDDEALCGPALSAGV